MLTLNKIIQRIQTIAEAHEQINTFFFGDVDDFLQSDVVYPACFISVPSETITGTQGGGSELVMSFNLFFVDRTIIGGSESLKDFNQTEVMSDMRSVALDILAQMQYQKFSPQWLVNKDATINYFNERFEDYTAGVVLGITISNRLTLDRCAAPSTFNYVG